MFVFATLPFLFLAAFCKREHVESSALKCLKIKYLKIIDSRISFGCNNLDLLSPKPKFTLRNLMKEVYEFHRKFVLEFADKAANNFVVI